MNPLLLSLCREIRALPQADDLMVFGSMLDRPDTAGDLDLALNDSEYWGRSERTTLVNSLLRLGQYGGPYYGGLDVFVVTPETLLVRDEECHTLVVATRARELRKAIAQGEAFGTWYERVVVPRLMAAQEPVPTQKDLLQAMQDHRKAQAEAHERRLQEWQIAIAQEADALSRQGPSSSSPADPQRRPSFSGA